MTPEGKVKTAVRNFLKKEGVWFYMPAQNGMGVVGIPDLICCAPVTITEDMVGKKLGVFMGVETKAPGKIKNTTANQRRNLETIHMAGGIAVVAVDTNIVESALKGVKKYGNSMYFVP